MPFFRTMVMATVAALALPVAVNAQPVAQSMPPLPADMRSDAFPGVIQLDVDASDIAHAVYRVRQTIPVAQAGQLTLRSPEWLPGNHSPTGEISALTGLAFSAGGQPLRWRRDPVDVFAFHVDVPAGAQAIEASFEFLAPSRRTEGRVVITPAMLNIQWEQVSLYPAGYAVRNVRVRPSVTLPQGWTGFAALDGAVATGATTRFAETDYETLIDSPMFAGAHARSWDLGHNVSLNVVADEDRFLAATDAQIAAHRALVDESLLLFGVRHFDRYQFLLGLTAEMGGIGLEHHRSSENTRETDYFVEWDANGSERGLLPHEFTHSWNGKFRRPETLWTPDYHQPMDDRLLWVYEGQTQYWGNVLAARSGLQSADMVLGNLARLAAGYQIQSGRAWRSLEDTTLDPIIAARRPRPYPSRSRVEDYYNEGLLIWLEADMLIRTQSRGQRSLDYFARRFFGGRDGDWGTSTYDIDGVVAALTAVWPHDWAEFLRTRVTEPGQAPPLAGITAGGYRLVFRDTPNAFDAERMRESKTMDLLFSLGVTLNKDHEVTAVQWGSPMFDQGISNGTDIIAVNGLEFSEERMKLAITAAMDGRTPIELLVQKNGRYRTIQPVWTGGLRYPHLERASDGPALIDQLLAPRRAGTTPN